MSATRPYLSDEEIQQYVDGELSETRYQEVTEYLESDPVSAKRVAMYRDINSLVAGYHLDVLNQPVPQRLKLQGGPRFAGTVRRLAAAIALLTIGFLVGSQFHSLRLPTNSAVTPILFQEALAAHRVFTPESRHPVEVGAEESGHLEKWLGKRLSFEFHIPQIEDFGYRLLGGRLLTGDSVSPHALIMYERDDGARLSLYITRNTDPAADTPLVFHEEDGLGLYFWTHEYLNCVVVMTLDEDFDPARFHELSDTIYERIEL